MSALPILLPPFTSLPAREQIVCVALLIPGIALNVFWIRMWLRDRYEEQVAPDGDAPPSYVWRARLARMRRLQQEHERNSGSQQQ